MHKSSKIWTLLKLASIGSISMFWSICVFCFNKYSTCYSFFNLLLAMEIKKDSFSLEINRIIILAGTFQIFPFSQQLDFFNAFWFFWKYN